jgi:alpha-beta hydrolase superfamily lysophospholipase
MPTFLLIAMLLTCGVIVASAAIGLMAWGLIHPPRMTDGKAIARLHRLSPGDLGLRFESLKFGIRDEQGHELSLAAWWIPSATESSRCAVLLHGYADAKVGAIAWAPIFHEAGCNILALDLRAHGESDGDYTTAGFYERHDVAQVLGQLRAARPVATQQFVLFGASSGAAVALAAAAPSDEFPPLDIAALVLDSPYADFRQAAMANYDRLGAPGRFFQRLALRLAAAITKSNYAAVAPLSILSRVAAPILMILPDSDPVVSSEDRVRLQQAMADRANPLDNFWLVPNCPHLLALQKDPAEYARRVRGFLETLGDKQTTLIAKYDHVI